MNLMTIIILICVSFVTGRIYEYRLNLKECEECENINCWRVRK